METCFGGLTFPCKYKGTGQVAKHNKGSGLFSLHFRLSIEIHSIVIHENYFCSLRVSSLHCLSPFKAGGTWSNSFTYFPSILFTLCITRALPDGELFYG